jgi:membrane-associated phospholipid phosphatase
MDYAIVHALNALVIAHPLLVDAARLLATWIVPVVVAATLMPWLASGAGADARKRVTAGALLAAGAAMAVNQVIGALWQRPRPFAAHPDGIVPFTALSTDPSFPSDHAAAAFAIAVAALLAYRPAGRVLLGLAVLVAASRVLIAAHYPTDVLAGAVVGAVSGIVVSRLEALWLPIVRGVAAVTDPVAAYARRVRGLGPLLTDRSLHRRVVLVAGLAVGVRFAIAMRHHLLDEMPLSLLAVWVACVVLAARLAYGGARPSRRTAT